jgi:hypothetical protein
MIQPTVSYTNYLVFLSYDVGVIKKGLRNLARIGA